MDVSTILVNYNTKEMTLDCINSIYDKTNGVEFEVIVVDNNSSDGSKEVLSDDKRITFVEAGDNLGFGKANNLGLKHASGRYIFFLNTDTLLVNNAIKLFFDFCESHKNEHMGGVGCLLQDRNGEIIHSFARFPSIRQQFLEFTIAPILKKIGMAYQTLDTTSTDTTKESFQVDYVTGADLFVSKEVIDKCGAFDSDFFMYFEETEMQYRWTKNGYPSYIYKAPKIIHLEGGSVNKEKSPWNTRKFIMGLKSKDLYFEKTRNKLAYGCYRLLSLMNIYVAYHHHFSKDEKNQVMKVLFS